MEVLEPFIHAEFAAVQEADLETLYEQVFPAVARFVSRLGGSCQDAKDIFQDALVVYLEKQAEGAGAAAMSEEAYIVGIAKHLWLRKFRIDKDKVSFDAVEREIAVPEDFYDEENNRLLQLLESAGRKCLDLLQAFYYEKLGLGEIAAAFGFRTVRSATVQKYKCLEKVRETVKQKGMSYEDLV